MQPHIDICQSKSTKMPTELKILTINFVSADHDDNIGFHTS